MLRTLLPLILAVTAILSARATDMPVINQQLRDSLASELQQATTPADSLRLALDLFDTSNFNDGIVYGELAYRLAIQLNKQEVMYDLLGQLVHSYRNDADMLRVMQYRIGKMPAGPEQKELATYVQVRIINIESKQFSNDKLNQLIRKFINESKAGQDDLYTKIEQLFSICIYLQALYNESELMREYFDQLEELIQQLPHPNWFLPMFFYDVLATCYSTQYDSTAALKADRELIPFILERRKSNTAHGRNYRTLDYNLFNSYRRMLANHIMLTPPEIDSIYNNIIDITGHNDIIKADFDNCKRSQIYYMISQEQYAPALKLLKEVCEKPVNQPFAYLLYRYMMTAAKSTGDKEAELFASRKYIELMEDYINHQTERSLQELTFAYKINDYKASIDLMAKENQQQLEDGQRQLVIGVSAAAAIILIALVLVFVLWRRARANAIKLTQLNRQLKDERTNLENTRDSLIKARDQAKEADRLKSDFINLMSHQVKAPLEAIAEYSRLIVDCMDEQKRKYLEHFANVVLMNTDLIMSLVNDLTEISSLEAKQMNVEIHLTDVRELCRMTVDSLSRNVPEGMQVVVADGPEVTIPTDSRRIEQILTNLVENAIKFGERGKVTVSYNADHAARKLTLAVADQGPGIPADKREAIFERFIKLDPQTAGVGLGLYASRLLAQLLGGSVEVDPDYRHGARFIVTIPF